MFPRSQSLNKSALRNKYGLIPAGPTFKYFGDGSELSDKAQTRFQKSGMLLGDRFLSPVPKVIKQSYFRQSDFDSKPMQTPSQNSTVDNFGQVGLQCQKDFKKTVLKESQIFQANTDKTQTVSILREQVGELGGRLKHLQDIILGLSNGESTFNQEVGNFKMRVSSSERTFKHNFQKVFTPRKVPIPSSHGTENILKTLENQLPYTSKRANQSSCFCGNSKQKEEMSGIIFELYQENRFYERELTKVNEPQRSSILKNAHRMKELLAKVRHL